MLRGAHPLVRPLRLPPVTRSAAAGEERPCHGMPLARCIPGWGRLGHLWAPCSRQGARLCSGAAAWPLASVGGLAVPRPRPGRRHAGWLWGLPTGCWRPAVLMGCEAGHAMPGLGLGGQQRLGQERTPRAPLPAWARGRQVAACGQWRAGAAQERGGGGAASPRAACPASAGAPRWRGWASSQVRPLPAPGEERGFCAPGGRGRAGSPVRWGHRGRGLFGGN